MYEISNLFSLQSRLPKAATSLKVLAELPIIVVLMYQVWLCIQYSRKLLREKTFTNFAVLEPPAKVFSAIFGPMIGFSIPWKFSLRNGPSYGSAKVSRYTVLILCLHANTSLSLFLPPPPHFLSLSLQLYKQTVHNTVAEFIPLTMKTIVLQPSAKARQAPDFNREAYVDFVAVQIKFLSFLAYIIRIYQDQVGEGGRQTHTHTRYACIMINFCGLSFYCW